MKKNRIELKSNQKEVGLLVRVSTEKEVQDASYEEQYDELEKFARAKGFKVKKVYQERVTGTKISGRDAFDEMIDDIVNKRIGGIIVKDLSRSARNIEVAARLKRLCLENEVGIYSVTEGDHLELETLNYNFKAMMNEHYSTDLSIKIKSRFKSRMEKGEYLKGVGPYGYYVENCKLFISNDETPDIVRRIFQEYLDGSGVDSIAKRLTNDGVITPSLKKGKKNAGIRWWGTTVKQILENRTYCGDTEQGKEETASAISKVRIKHEHGVLVENTHEPIIPKEMFLEVQALIASRKAGPRATPKKHLFTDILTCGKCGKYYWYRSAGDRYICGSYARHGKKACSANAVKADYIKKLVINELNNIVKTYQLNKKIDDMVEAKLKSKIYKVKSELGILKEKRQKFEEAKADLIVAKVTKDITIQEYDLSVKRIDKTIEDIDKRLDVLEKANLEVDQQKVQKQLKKVFFGIDTFEDLNRETLHRFVDRIIVKGKDEFEIVYRFSL